jgi:hypothetical protein
MHARGVGGGMWRDHRVSVLLLEPVRKGVGESRAETVLFLPGDFIRVFYLGILSGDFIRGFDPGILSGELIRGLYPVTFFKKIPVFFRGLLSSPDKVPG